MAAKSDAGAKDAKADAPASASAAAPAGRGGMAAWLPLIIALVAAPAATWATVEFVLLPRLQKKIAAHPAEGAAVEAHAEPAHEAPAAGGHGAKPKSSGGHGKESGGAEASYQFENVVVNLAGTMGTRYLKTTFLVTGADANIAAVFTGSKARLTDVTLNVLSSLTLADLEEAGAKNLIREKLVNAYNQALGRKVAEQVYFSDFVIQ